MKILTNRKYAELMAATSDKRYMELLETEREVRSWEITVENNELTISQLKKVIADRNKEIRKLKAQLQKMTPKNGQMAQLP